MDGGLLEKFVLKQKSFKYKKMKLFKINLLIKSNDPKNLKGLQKEHIKFN
jgi:hypothetical protein